MTADVRAWLTDLAARDPAAARQAGAAVLALLDQGPELGGPLAARVTPLAAPWGSRGAAEPDPGEALDEAYQELLEYLSSSRREVADIATLRRQLERQLEEPAATLPPAEADELRRRYAELSDAEEKITASSQLLEVRVDEFRLRKESVKAGYTAAEALRRISELGGQASLDDPAPDASLPGAETALAEARSQAKALLRIAAETRPGGRQVADTPEAAADPGPDAPPVELMVLRPAAPRCLATRILFTFEPADRAGSTVVLLAAGTEHASPGGGADRLIDLARSRAAAGGARPSSYDGDDFVDEFFSGAEAGLIDEVTALAAAGQPRGLGEVRELLGLTQEQLAERLGVNTEQVAATERDGIGLAGIGTLAAYAEALGGRLDLSVDLGTERIPLG
jgi:DNA-binding XRE family transcriptional regulator